MKPLDQQQIRTAMVTSTTGEARRVLLPAGFAGLEFSDLEIPRGARSEGATAFVDRVLT